MKRKPFMERIGDVLAGKGFYIVLFLCVAAIGISGYYLISGFEFSGDDTAAAGKAQVVVTSTPNVKVPEVKATPTPTPEPTVQPSAEPASTPAPVPSATPAPARKTVYTWPVKGEIISGFSLEVLAYDPTMGDWRTHSGIDIGAALGTQVLAASAGTVESVAQDDLMGTVVTIDHGGGMSSMYANLAATPTVKAGDSVETGAVIGTVGDTAIAEINRPSHLHFELMKNGVSVDPEDYLP